MSYNKVDPTTGALTKIAGLVDDTDLKADIAEVQAVIPSDASSSNKLVDMSKFGAIEALTYSDADLKTFTENVCKTIKYAGSAEIPSSTNISCGFMNITQGTDQVTQMLFQFNEGKIWTRSRYGTWTSWQQITPTSTVTSGSTAPITSGGVYNYVSKHNFPSVDVSTSEASTVADAIKVALNKIGFSKINQTIEVYFGYESALRYIKASCIGYSGVARIVGEAYGYGGSGFHNFIYGNADSQTLSVTTISVV